MTDKTRYIHLNVRCYPDEYERWTQAAERDERSLSSWVRIVLDREARRERKPNTVAETKREQAEKEGWKW